MSERSERSQRRDQLRAADIDRKFVADILKKAIDEGRLTLSEYDERLQRTYQALTYGDLDKIIMDLPRPSRRSAVTPTGPHLPKSPISPVSPAGDRWSPQPAARDPEWLRRAWRAWAVAVAINTVIWLIVMLAAWEWVYPWPLWVAGPWGSVLVVCAIFGRAGDSRR